MCMRGGGFPSARPSRSRCSEGRRSSRSPRRFITGIDFDQAYPYDTATLTAAMTRTQDGSTIGFNIGADIAVYFSRWVGVGGLIRFSRSEVDLGDGPTTIAVGGLHTAAGLRLRF